jgi:hypothetical protein
MQSGRWEATVSAGDQTSTNTHCITPEQVKTANGSREEIRASLQKSAARLHCTLDDFKIEEKTFPTFTCARENRLKVRRSTTAIAM